MNLCVLFGGSSYEHEISIVSAITLKKLLPSIETFVFLDGNHENFDFLATFPVEQWNGGKIHRISNKNYTQFRYL